jgi:hypothetical protein
VSIIRFDPTAASSTIKFTRAGAGSSRLYGGVLRDIGIYGQDTTYEKAGVEFVDVSEMTVSNVAVGNYGGTGWQTSGVGTSTGFRLKGRELTTLEKIVVHVEVPISIEDNPWDAPTATTDPAAGIDIDHFRFRDNTLIAMDMVSPIMSIADGVNLGNVSIEEQSWNLGGYGLRWVDTSTSRVSFNLSLSNVREQSTNATGYFIDIEHTPFP